MTRYLILSGLLGLMLVPDALAQALSAEQNVSKLIETTDENGNIVEKRVAADSVAPGDRVMYQLDYTHTGREPASDILLTMAVPRQIKPLFEGLHAGETTRSFSVDGGQTYQALTTSPEGEAPPEFASATHLRWQLVSPIQPGESGSVSYTGIVE